MAGKQERVTRLIMLELLYALLRHDTVRIKSNTIKSITFVQFTQVGSLSTKTFNKGQWILSSRAFFLYFYLGYIFVHPGIQKFRKKSIYIFFLQYQVIIVSHSTKYFSFLYIIIINIFNTDNK